MKEQMKGLGGALFFAMVGMQVDAMAGPLQKENVARDAKWVVHLDFEAFRETAIGKHVMTRILQPKIDENGWVKKANLSLDLTNIGSITAYGPDYQRNGEGVLLLNTSADVKKDLDTLVGMAEVSGDGEKKAKMLTQSPVPIYQFMGDLLVAPLRGGTVVAAKSREQLDRAREILEGKQESLAKTEAFKAFGEVKDSFFFFGLAQGFNEQVDIPPQAQVLRETDGGRLVVGEKGENVFLQMTLRGKTEESTTKIQQVLQGIVALISMTQQNNEAAELASAAKISAEGRNVGVSLKFPTSKVIERANRHVKIEVEEEAIGGDIEVTDREE
jgi:hypothetical protein